MKLALRQLRKSPGFSFIAILTLALGIGSTTAIFSVLSGLLLNPLPYRDSSRIVEIAESPAPGAFAGSCGGTFLEWQEHQQHFEFVAASHAITKNLTGHGDPRIVQVWEVTPQFLSVFGLRPAQGRDFRPEDDVAGANHHLAIVSHRFWQTTLNGDATIVGQLLQLDGDAYQIIGILEPDALLNPEVDFLAPTGLLSAEHKQDRNYTYVTTTLARLKPGATPEAAAAQLTAVKQSFNHLYPERKKDWSVAVRTLQEQMFGGARQPLGLLFWSVAVVLLIACANVANLLLARTAARQGEFALRAALGASRGRIIRQLLSESLLLAVLGGLGGVWLASFAIDPLLAFAQVNNVQRLDIGLDFRVLAFAIGATLLTGLLTGLLPALGASRPDVNESLKEGVRTATSGKRKRLQSALIVGETALTVILLVVAGLLIRSFFNAAAARTGFNRAGALTFRVVQSGDTAQTTEKRLQFTDRILDELRRIPGVTAAGMTSAIPMNGRRFFGDAVRRADQPQTDANITAGFDGVSPGYFDAMGIPLLRGRHLTEADNRADAPKVMLISESMVSRFFPDGQDPLGHRIWFKNDAWEIVGVVGDIRKFALDNEPALQVYFAQVHFPWHTHYIVRTGVSPLTLAAQVRQAVRNVHPDQPISDLNTLDELARATLSFRTVMLTLLSLFAGVALLLACIGIYGVMAYTVTQRTREMGIRLALGAAARDVIQLVLSDGLKVILIGLASGAVVAGLAALFLRSQLYEVDPLDPTTFLAVTLLLLLVGAASCLLPARRATKVDPMTALRSD